MSIDSIFLSELFICLRFFFLRSLSGLSILAQSFSCGDFEPVHWPAPRFFAGGVLPENRSDPVPCGQVIISSIASFFQLRVLKFAFLALFFKSAFLPFLF
jgi:hypothetical protein